jgi:hypothetical protein
MRDALYALHTYIHTYTHTYTYIRIHTYTYMHIRTYICIHTSIHTYAYKSTYIHASGETSRSLRLQISYIFSSTLKMEAIRSSETSVNTTYTRCHIPEDCFLQHRTLFWACNLGWLRAKFWKYLDLERRNNRRTGDSYTMVIFIIYTPHKIFWLVKNGIFKICSKHGAMGSGYENLREDVMGRDHLVDYLMISCRILLY